MLIFPANDIQSHPELLEKSDYPTAFFCENDSIAISLIKSLQDIVMRIPEDISIIGFDNITEGKVIDPALTTIEIPRHFMGQTAARQLIQEIETPLPHTVKIEISTTLVKRFSV